MGLKFSIKFSPIQLLNSITSGAQLPVMDLKNPVVSLFSQVFSLLIVAIGVYAKVQKATGIHTTHFINTVYRV